MKSLNLARPIVLMIVGLPGAGKSFFARQFSEMFNAPVVSFDRLRFELFANPTHSNDENDLVGRVAGYMVEELFKSNHTFIVDGGCNSRIERTKLGQAARKAGFETIAIWVQTDHATAKGRSLKRNPDKREDDQFNRSLSEQTFATLAKRFTEPSRENYVVISGKHTYNTQAKMVLRKLIATREASAEAAHRQEIEHVKQSPPRPDSLRRSVIIR